MINMINLLPAQQQQKLLIIRRTKLINIIGLLALLFVLSLLLGVLALKFRLQGELVLAQALEGAARIELIKPENIQLKKDLLELNRKLKQILTLEQQYQPGSEILKTLSALTPTGLTYNSLLFDRQANKVTLTGLAKQRAELLLFKQELEKALTFSAIDFPAVNWVKATDINFFITFKYRGE